MALRSYLLSSINVFEDVVGYSGIGGSTLYNMQESDLVEPASKLSSDVPVVFQELPGAANPPHHERDPASYRMRSFSAGASFLSLSEGIYELVLGMRCTGHRPSIPSFL